MVGEEGDVCRIPAGGDAEKALSWGESRGIDHLPAAVDERLSDRVEVHRAEAWRVDGGHAGGYVERAQQSNYEMGVVPADSLAGEKSTHRAVRDTTRSRNVIEAIVHPGADGREQLKTAEAPEFG